MIPAADEEPDVEAALPPLDGLDVAAAAEVAVALRTRIRPALLKRLARIGDGDAIDVLLTRRQLELQMMAVLSYAVRLEARFFPVSALTPADLQVARFSVRERSVAPPLVVARAHCFLTPESCMFVHSPCLFHHAAVLLRDLLDAGERLRVLRDFRIRREVVFEPVIAVWYTGDDDAAAPGPPSPLPSAARDADFQGTFVTTAGRSFRFAGWQDRCHPVRERAAAHRLTSRLLHRLPDTDPGQAFPSFGLSLRGIAPGDLPADPADALMLVLEIAIAGTMLGVGQDGRSWLLARGSQIDIPDDAGAWLRAAPRFDMAMDRRRIRRLPGRGQIMPFSYRITPPDAAWNTGLMACLDGHTAFLPPSMQTTTAPAHDRGT